MNRSRSGFPALALALGPLLVPIAPGAGTAAPVTPYPVMFVTQAPIPQDFTTINATFGNHKPGIKDAGRGGDLWIRYPDGTLKNLTAAAGYGNDGFQGLGSIGVREPDVHWDGQKAVFSMVVGWVENRYEVRNDFRWQLYEITGLGPSDTPVITQVQNQPAEFNNIMPVYGSDDRIIFVSDRPRNGALHLWPPLDEYELAPSNSGLWSLDPASGDLDLLDHSPSGDFHPLVDSYGRVIFTRWDHLQRDQQADADSGGGVCGTTTYGTGNYSDESATAIWDPNDRTEVFPEPRPCRTDLLAGTGLYGHTFNQFIPWMILQDGTEAETLNHIGRHELRDYLDRARTDDPNVVEFFGPGPRANRNVLSNLFQIAESPVTPGDYLAIDAPEFGTHSAGQVVKIGGDPAIYADQMVVRYLTHRDTSSYTDTPSPDHSGLYRDPLVLSDGTIVAAHTIETREDRNQGSTANPISRYAFALKTLAVAPNSYLEDAEPLTAGISRSLSWWDPDTMVTHSGPMWELNPVEVRARTRPPIVPAALPAPEQAVFNEEGVDLAGFKNWLAANDLALVVSRDVTTRDRADRQQPFNLRVPGGVESIAATGAVYDVPHMQFFQADQLRGWSGCCSTTPNLGRRVLARPLHEAAALGCDPTPVGAPEGAKTVALDGSLAAIVPARRALTWQLTDPTGEGVVRERYWLSFQPGETRVCASCHGLNSADQLARPVPQNKPEALRALLRQWTGCAAGGAKLLRNTDVTAILPVPSPPLATIFPLTVNRDFHQDLSMPGDLDADATIVGDATRPLVLYTLDRTGKVKLVKNAAGRLAIYFD